MEEIESVTKLVEVAIKLGLVAMGLAVIGLGVCVTVIIIKAINELRQK